MPGPPWTEFLDRNQKYSETNHLPRPFAKDVAPLIGSPESLFPQVLIFCCFDFRVPPLEFLDAKGKEIFVVQNLGGRVKDSLTPLIFIDTFSNGKALEQVIIIHHTDCGLTHATNDGLRASLKTEYPHHLKEIEDIDFGTYEGGDVKKHETALKEDIDLFKASPLVRQELKDTVRGYLYDITSGKLVLVREG